MLGRILVCTLFLGASMLGRPSVAMTPKAAVAPAYPPLAALARIAGTVVVRLTIDGSGNVISARAVTGHPLLKGAASGAADEWKFESAPARVRETDVRFTFVLLPERDEPHLRTIFLPPSEVRIEYAPTKPPVNYHQGN